MNEKLIPRLLAIALAAVMISILLRVSWPVSDPDQSTNNDLGEMLFGNLTDPGFSPILIMIAVMLLVALLGAVFLAKEEERGEKK